MPDFPIKVRLPDYSSSLQAITPRILAKQLLATDISLIQLALDPLREAPAVWGGIGSGLETSRQDGQAALRKSEPEAIEWNPLWGKPAVFASIVLVAFLLFFRDNPSVATVTRLTRTEPKFFVPSL